MSVGHSLHYHWNTRNPLIERFLELRAINEGASVTMDAVLEPSRITQTVINQFVKRSHIVESEKGKLFLNVEKVKHDAFRMGLLQLALGEIILVIILLLTLFAPTVVEIPLIAQVAIFIVGNAFIGVLTYLEAWPYFRLRRIPS